jgi:hypothetical protein
MDVEDGTVNHRLKNVGCEWKMATILRPVPPHYLSYRNRGKLQRYFYFFAHVSIASFAVISNFLKYLLTFTATTAPRYMVVVE